MTENFGVSSMYCAAPSDAIMHTSLGEGAALLDLRDNNYFSLDPVGALVWQALQSPRSKAYLVSQICAVYDVDEQTCAADIEVLLGELVNASLVDVVPPQAQ